MNSLEANIRDNSTKGQLNAIRNNGKVEILFGLKEGDLIVAEGLKKVRHKGKIKPIIN